MKANQKFLMDNERGDIGVGTLIIFIAMVLVAAVAATVLIYTTGSLQQKATKTSKEATQQISSNIVVEQVIGNRSDLNNEINQSIQKIILRVKPDVGTTSIDLRQVIVSVQDETKRLDIYYTGSTLGNTDLTYSANSIRDADISFTTTVPVMNSGDLIEITLSQDSLDNMSLPPRKTILLSLSQERGQAVNLEITTPNSYGINQYVPLYP
jgi:flagellin FlaB